MGRNSLVLQLLKMVREMFRLGMMDLDTPVTQDVLATLLEVLQKMDSLPLTQPARCVESLAMANGACALATKRSCGSMPGVNERTPTRPFFLLSPGSTAAMRPRW